MVSPEIRYVVVLATFNGARYVDALLESISVQDPRPEKIFVRDDGSEDHTIAEVTASATALGLKTEWLPTDGRKGVCGSFSKLLEKASDYPYVFLADQDDLWEPDKAASMLTAMRAAEDASAHDFPVLVHSDLNVIDDKGGVIAKSFFEYQGLGFSGGDFSSLLLQNNVTGCACLLNACLVRRCMPIPAEAVMHDWWIGLVASAFGRKVFLASPYTRYRQHDRNVIGAHRWGLRYIIQRGREILSADGARRAVHPVVRQARAFHERFGGELPMELQSQLLAVMTLGSKRRWLRLGGLCRVIGGKQGVLRKCGFAFATMRSAALLEGPSRD